MKQLNTLMQKEMTRKEFLTTLGFGLASIMGFSTIVHFLFGKGEHRLHEVGSGYGSSVYGGEKVKS